MAEKDRSSDKDWWDKLTSLTPVFATTLIGLLGLYFTNTYEAANQARNNSLDEQARVAAAHDTKIRELEAVEKLLPHLSSVNGTREGQKLALIAIRELGSAKSLSNLPKSSVPKVPEMRLNSPQIQLILPKMSVQLERL